ncbi:MAG: WxL domain-containing protein, partial [Solirubrobacteraceae bacterium]|nr:WxL domain-containing protein [Solirubrobacteraceae bacterium]
QTGTFVGWNLSATSTTFTSGGNTLPTTATTFTGVTPTAVTTAGEARCSAPTSSVGYPLTLPAAAVAPAAVKIFNAAANTGRGGTQLVFNASLGIPASTRVGSYSSTWTFTLATGP